MKKNNVLPSLKSKTQLNHGKKKEVVKERSGKSVLRKALHEIKDEVRAICKSKAYRYISSIQNQIQACTI